MAKYFFLLILLTSTAYSNEQCVAHFEPSTGMANIPCLKIGEQEIWVNLQLTDANGTLKLDTLGDKFLPNWLLQMIQEIKTAEVANPPIEIYQYRYKDNIVYYVTSDCCDQYDTLYDYDGKGICAPSGGFTGRGDGKCEDFFSEIDDGVSVWKDTRNYPE